MKNNMLGFLFGVGMVLLTACGGGNDVFEDPFAGLSENPPSSALVGDWTLTAEITEITTNDGDLCTASEAEVGVTADVDISISETDCTTEASDDENFTLSCQAADDTAVVSISGFSEDTDNDCAYVSDTVINATMAEDGTWSGTFDSRLIVSGDCTGDLPEGLCEVTGTVTGVAIDTTVIIDPTTIDADVDGYDSDADCDDTDASIYPGATETADDGIDQDCDGSDSVTDACTEGDATCDLDLDDDGLCDNEALCEGNNIDPDADYANEWYWVDSENGNSQLDLTSPVLIALRTFQDGTYDADTIVVFGVIDGFKDQSLIYTFCNGFYGSLTGICIEK